MHVRAYLNKGWVSDTSKSAETVNSETPLRQPKKCQINNKHHIIIVRAALFRFLQILLAARRNNTT